jgi:CspA family cold shock protein
MSKKEIGRVKWFKDDKGFGFIERAAGEDVFVHYTAIEGGTGRRTLRQNDRVEFVLTEGKKGLQAEQVVVIGED